MGIHAPQVHNVWNFEKLARNALGVNVGDSSQGVSIVFRFISPEMGRKRRF
jgi:hypothetical protein